MTSRGRDSCWTAVLSGSRLEDPEAAGEALAADDLDRAQLQIDIGFAELAAYEACVELEPTL